MIFNIGPKRNEGMENRQVNMFQGREKVKVKKTAIGFKQTE